MEGYGAHTETIGSIVLCMKIILIYTKHNEIYPNPCYYMYEDRIDIKT